MRKKTQKHTNILDFGIKSKYRRFRIIVEFVDSFDETANSIKINIMHQITNTRLKNIILCKIYRSHITIVKTFGIVFTTKSINQI